MPSNQTSADLPGCDRHPACRECGDGGVVYHTLKGGVQLYRVGASYQADGEDTVETWCSCPAGLRAKQAHARRQPVSFP